MHNWRRAECTSLSLSVTLVLILFIADDSYIQPAYCLIQLDGEGPWKYAQRLKGGKLPDQAFRQRLLLITLSHPSHALTYHLSNSTLVAYHVARSLIRNFEAR
jgi:hypothetical protein